MHAGYIDFVRFGHASPNIPRTYIGQETESARRALLASGEQWEKSARDSKLYDVQT